VEWKDPNALTWFQIASHQDAAELHQCVERFVGGTLLAHWVRIQCNAFQLNAQVVMKREHHPMHAVRPRTAICSKMS
jgi:hypothetical protein